MKITPIKIEDVQIIANLLKEDLFNLRVKKNIEGMMYLRNRSNDAVVQVDIVTHEMFIITLHKKHNPENCEKIATYVWPTDTPLYLGPDLPGSEEYRKHLETILLPFKLACELGITQNLFADG